MKRVREWKDRVFFKCPACKEEHQIKTGADGWAYNGITEAPTFTPSVLVTGVQTVNDENYKWTGEVVRDADGNTVPQLCHSFVSNGNIQFLTDCKHELAGQTVPLPVYEEGEAE